MALERHDGFGRAFVTNRSAHAAAGKGNLQWHGLIFCAAFGKTVCGEVESDAVFKKRFEASKH